MNDRTCPINRFPVGLWMKATTALTAENNRKMANMSGDPFR